MDTKISLYLGHSLPVETYHNPSERLPIVLDIEIDPMCDFRSFGSSRLAHKEEGSGQNDHERD